MSRYPTSKDLLRYFKEVVPNDKSLLSQIFLINKFI